MQKNVAYTIATVNYLAQARTTGDSFLKHHPDFEFFIYLIDNKQEIPDSPWLAGFSVIDSASGSIPEFAQMRGRYNNFELSCALKPYVADLLMDTTGADLIYYFDSDIFIFSEASLLRTALDTNSIALTPHVTSPERGEPDTQMDRFFLQYGLYNGGFFAIRRSAEARAFLKWWKEKMLNEATVDLENGRYVDQIWLNYAPLFFEGVVIIKDPGYNMAIWNAIDRKISVRNQSEFWVNDAVPLVFYHFTQYNVTTPEIICGPMPRHTFDERPDLRPVFRYYADRLIANDIAYYKSLVKPLPPKAIGVRKRLGNVIRRVLTKFGF